eukprot:TRINITY_DN21835_c0_g1_i2.p1 TRINITY_DN21835_c0_g1~~TRINITY_DN21835_c0_g1_i2.p1  ORF type:complete len:499 (+),score=103.06 TRINITY_DN21835_c0_g1_i2:135-1631(+)
MTSVTLGDLPPRHLIFLVHGFNGCTACFEVVTGKILDFWGDSIAVHACCSNNDPPLDSNKTFLTYDGIDKGGRRLAAEVEEVIASWGRQHLLSVSFWGHSLGGLYIRWALADLVDACEGAIMGVPLRAFVTTASPHLGVAGTFPDAVLAGGALFKVIGDTGQQLFLEDLEGLVLQMALEDRFLAPLRKFQYLLLVANVCNDWAVDFTVSALQRHLPQWLLEAPPLSDDCPHVVFDSGDWTQPLAAVCLEQPSSCPRSAAEEDKPAAQTGYLPAGLIDMLPEAPSAAMLGGASMEALLAWTQAAPMPSAKVSESSPRRRSQKRTELQELQRAQRQENPAKPTGDVEKSVAYCAGHRDEVLILEARDSLAALPWRLICTRFNEHSLQVAHDEVVCARADVNEVGRSFLDYLCGKMFKEIFQRRPKGKKALTSTQAALRILRASLKNGYSSLSGGHCRGVSKASQKRVNASAEACVRDDAHESERRLKSCVPAEGGVSAEP